MTARAGVRTAAALVLATGGPTGGPIAVAGSAGHPPGSAVIAVVDNAFHRGVDRPTVRLRRGGVVTWHWQSRSSHEVTVAHGPRRFHSPTRNHGRYSVRLSLPGTYRIVCSIHTPGMRMTLIVR
jgi:plastocyanin